MTDRIKKLAEMTANGDMFIESTPTQYDREDIFLSPLKMQAKRTYEYILNQTPYVSELTALTGYLRFDGSVEGDIFGRAGHKNIGIMLRDFYNKPIDGLCVVEWQHSVADFAKVIRIGINGYINEISLSKKHHTDEAELEFLDALDTVAHAIIGWAEKCSEAAAKKAAETQDDECRKNMKMLSAALKKVPAEPASSFYEALLAVYVIYAFVPDSIGTIDRYLYPFYKKDIENGTLTKENAKEYLQELFLMLQARIHKSSDRFYRGGESHFCIGGYTPDGEDGFNELSRLVVDSMLELPTWIPQISLRWTKKTPHEVLEYMMDCERKDPNKRIAFVNDEPRIKALMERAGFPYELACGYTMVGCNEPQLPGGIFMGGCDGNIAKSVTDLFDTADDTLYNAKDFDEFYALYEKSLFKSLDRMVEYHTKFQSVRARDTNIVSTMFFEGSIERAKSITQGGAKNAVANISAIGISTVIDSLAVVKQFVFDEGCVSMKTLAEALRSNWQGHEELRSEISKRANFFGNGDDTSNECADRFAKSMHRYYDGKKTDMGYPYMVGNLIGYNQHHKWFGDLTGATPDGRFSGDPLSFGIGQTDGRDRNGLTALLSSVTKLNQHTIFAGATVTNVLIDSKLVENDDNFKRIVSLFETYFKMGGLHFQLTYVSPEDLRAAKNDPEKYKSLRVRVSGFSDYFVLLNEDLQNDVIARTEHTA